MYNKEEKESEVTDVQKRMLPKRNQDLVRLVRGKILKQSAGYAIWVALLVSGAVMFNEQHQTYPPHMRMVGWRMVLWVAAALVSGFFVFRIYRLLADRTRIGRITGAGLSHNYTAPTAKHVSSDDSYDFRIHTTLRLQDERGKRHRLHFEQKDGFYTYYHEGERVLKLYGLPYPVNLDTDAKHGCICAVCGTIRKTPNSHCDACGHSLIHVSELTIQ